MALRQIECTWPKLPPTFMGHREYVLNWGGGHSKPLTIWTNYLNSSSERETLILPLTLDLSWILAQNWYSNFSEVLENYFETHLPSARIKQCQTKPLKMHNQFFIKNKATSFSGVLHSLVSLCSYILNTSTSKLFLHVLEWASTSSFSWAGLNRNFLSLQTDYALNKKLWCIKKTKWCC